MKKSRFTDSQIMAALKRVEVGLPVPEICRELGISSAPLSSRDVKLRYEECLQNWGNANTPQRR